MHTSSTVSEMTLKMTDRNRLEIIYFILSSVGNPGTTMEHILSRSDFTPSLVRRYLAFLVEKGILRTEKTNNKLVYELTTRGGEFIHRYKDLEESSYSRKVERSVTSQAVRPNRRRPYYPWSPNLSKQHVWRRPLYFLTFRIQWSRMRENLLSVFRDI